MSGTSGTLIPDSFNSFGELLRYLRERAELSQRELASDFSGVQCLVLAFGDVAFNQEFDAIWACASLLHVPRQELLEVLRRFWRALIERGVMFASFQSGGGEVIMPDGRFFVYYMPEELTRVFEQAGFTVVETWETLDTLHGRSGIEWINIVARR